MTDRLREIEQRCESLVSPWWNVEKQELSFDSEQAGIVLTLIKEDIPYLLGVIKEQAEEIERLQEKDIQSAADICGSLSAYARWRESMGSNEGHSEEKGNP